MHDLMYKYSTLFYFKVNFKKDGIENDFSVLENFGLKKYTS